MATLTAHGKEVGRFYGLVTVKSYMEDGTVMLHDGLGWRKYAILKPGLTPEQAVKNKSARESAILKEYPFFAEYRRALHELAPQSKRWALHGAVTMMPNDPDGVWSTMVDCIGPRTRLSVGIDEIVDLCRIYQSSVCEREEKNEGKGEGKSYAD